MERTNEENYPHLQALPEVPDAERFGLEERWVAELIANCNRVLWALSEEGIMDAFYPVANALDAGTPVPGDVRQPAIDFGNAWNFMFTTLRPKAIDWMARAKEAIETDSDVAGVNAQTDSDLDKVVAEWSAKLGGLIAAMPAPE